MAFSSKSSGTPLITPWAPAREDGTLQLTDLFPMFFKARTLSRLSDVGWRTKRSPILMISKIMLQPAIAFSSSEIFLRSLSRISLKLGPESLTLMNSGTEFGDLDIPEKCAEIDVIQYVSSKLSKRRGDAGTVESEEARARCRRWETGKRGANDDGNEGTYSGRSDGESMAKKGLKMAVRAKGGERGERTRWKFIGRLEVVECDCARRGFGQNSHSRPFRLIGFSFRLVSKEFAFLVHFVPFLWFVYHSKW